MSGDYVPGYCVIDAFASMLEEGVLKVYPLSKCISREQELQSVRADKQVVLLENQHLQVKPKGAELTADLGNELRVHLALVQGLALDMANLASYEAHENVMRELVGHLTRTPPHGFRGPSIESILRTPDRPIVWIKGFKPVVQTIVLNFFFNEYRSIFLLDLYLFFPSILPLAFFCFVKYVLKIIFVLKIYFGFF